ncbi:MAG: hypothetical protein M1376_13375 [Planctomycetes bacterium]|nr:hypothetical protein [Planctomycetota bacterium]
MERRHLGITLVLLSSFSAATSADFGGLALAGRTGSLGFGGGMMMNFLPDINGRFGAMYFPLGVSGKIGDVNYDFDLRVLTFPLTMDWYPFHQGFHLSSGLIFNQTRMDLDTGSGAALTIGGTTYAAADLGTVHGKASFHHIAPYVGIGWGNAFGNEGRWGVVGDLGVAFLGRPHVSLRATGPIAVEPSVMGDLAQEEQDVEDDLSVLRFYPVFSISLFYRF